MAALFRLYDRLGCLNAVAREAEALSLRSKRHRFRSGRVQGGNVFSRGQIYALLRNPIYLGKIRHKDKIWDGQHDAIIDTGLWDGVQARLQAASVRPRSRVANQNKPNPLQVAPLAGKLRDETGDRLTPSHTRRHGRQLRYYVSNRLISGGADPRGWRLPAPALEQAIARLIADHLEFHAGGHSLAAVPDIHSTDDIRTKAQAMAQTLRNGSADLLSQLLASGALAPKAIILALDSAVLATRLDLAPDDLDPAALMIQAPFALRRRGVEARLVTGEHQPEPDQIMLRALAHAHQWVADLKRGRPLSEIASATGHSESYIRTRTPLAFLSPDIQRAILNGQQPTELTLQRIVRKPVPLDWAEQARLYGFRDRKPAP